MTVAQPPIPTRSMVRHADRCFRSARSATRVTHWDFWRSCSAACSPVVPSPAPTAKSMACFSGSLIRRGFLPKGRTEELAQLVVDYMHSTPPAPGFDRVLVPGELEAQRAATRTMVQVSEAVWDQLCAAGHELGINVEAAEVPAEVANSRPT